MDKSSMASLSRQENDCSQTDFKQFKSLELYQARDDGQAAALNFGSRAYELVEIG